MKHIPVILFIFGFAVLSFLWGFSSSYFKIFPGQKVEAFISELESFIKGHSDEPATTPLQKIISDFGGLPARYINRSPYILKQPENSSEFLAKNKDILFKGYTNSPPEGYILVSGAFDFEGDYNKGLALFSTEGEYIRHWRIGGFKNLEFRNTSLANSIIDYKNSRIITGSSKILMAHDWCMDESEKPLALSFGNTHHNIEFAPDGSIWTSFGTEFNDKIGIVQLGAEKPDDLSNLEAIKRITFKEIIEANPEISPLSNRSKIVFDIDSDPGKLRPDIGYLEDPFHHNDVQPFVDKRFPTKSGYALAISVREQNIILVIDPDTKKILYYNQGIVERQHDPDYHNGSLYVYDNGTFRGYSRIVKFGFDEDIKENPFGFETIIDGRDYNWIDPSRGQHQVFEHGGKIYHLVINDRNGIIYIFNNSGKAVFAMQNYLKGEDMAVLQLRSGLFISPEQYQELEVSCKN
jgi:hypothetical protein